MRSLVLTLVLILGATSAWPSQRARAAEETYQAMGAPATPAVEARWNIYHDYAAATKLLQDLAAAHPDLARLESLGKSYGGRDMWVLTIADPAGGPLEARPAFWIDGGIHANEIQASEVVLYTAWFLLEARDYSPFIERILRERTFYLMPMMSPDSRDIHFHGAADSDSPRTGQRPVDNDRDGLVDEDGPDDLDGDGSITQMRIADPNGRWKENQDYPGWMQRCKLDEPGQYTMLRDEGLDNDGDGEVNEDEPGGYDPNRDWAWNWQPGYIQWGAWKYPLCVDENRMVAQFIIAHPAIAGAQTYHNSGGMVLHGPGQSSDAYPGADDALFNFIGQKGEAMLPGYKNMTLWRDLYPVWGGEIDWLYKMQGALAFTNELFTSYNYFREQAPPEGGWQGSRDDQRRFDKYLLFGEGYIPWHAVDHPQYGPIEVGGAKKTWGRQPPSFLLEEECHRNFAFTMFHADALPHLEVQSVTSRQLPGGLTEVTAVVANKGMMPTRLAVDVRSKITRPDWVSISGAGKVIAGYRGRNQFFLDTTEQKTHPERMKVEAIPGNGAVYLRWIVQGAGPYTVAVDSIKGGRAEGTSS